MEGCGERTSLNPTFLYLAAIFALAVWSARKTAARIDWRVASTIYAIVLAVMFQPLVLDTVMLPLDFLERIHPWQRDVVVHNPEMNDIPLQIVPWAHLVRESWMQGEVPLWNATALGGYPLLANAQSQALSPLRALGFPLSLGHSFALEAGLKLLISLWFTFVVVRRLGARDLHALIAAAVWSLSSAVTIWINFPMASVLCFLPAVWLGVDLLFERRSFSRYLFLSLVFTMLLLGGHPESAAHIVLIAGVYLLFLWSRSGLREGLRSTLAVLASGITSILLSLPFLLPFLEALPFTKRMAMLGTGGGWPESFHPQYFLISLQPLFFGSIRDQTAWGPAHSEVLMNFAGLAGVAGAFAGLWLVTRREGRGLAALLLALGLVTTLVAFDFPLISTLFDEIPPFSIAQNSRLRFVYCWVAALLLGLALSRLSKGDRRPMLFGAMAALVALISMYAYYWLTVPEIIGRSISMGWMGIPVALSAVWLALRPGRLPGTILLVLVVAELATFFHHRNTIVESALVYPKPPILEELDRLMAEDTLVPVRITGQGNVLFPNTPALFDLQDIRGHDPMASADVIGMLRVFTGYTSDQYFGTIQRFDHPLLDFMNVRWVLTAPNGSLDPATFRAVYEDPTGRIWQNVQAMPRFFSPRHTHMIDDDSERIERLLTLEDWRNAAVIQRIHSSMIETVHDDIFGPTPDQTRETEVRILSSSPRRYELEIDAARWSLIASSLPLFPGWRIWDDAGKELKVHEINEGFIGFLAPPGVTRVEVRYRPLSFYRGLQLSTLTILAVLLVGLFRRVRDRRRRTESG